MDKYVLGFDFGTLSVRALLVEIASGEAAAESTFDYPNRILDSELPGGVKLPAGFALQQPLDYLDGFQFTVKDILEKSRITAEDIVGIGIDFTSSTVIPVKNDGTPICTLDRFINEPHAYVKLWKHHGAENEARLIESVIKKRNESWFDLYGGKVSGEWMLPKILETLVKSPAVYKEADQFMECLDWITMILTGTISRSVCGAGYKMFYRHGFGYPSRELLMEIDPGFSDLPKKLSGPIKQIGEAAGRLTNAAAGKLGLKSGTPVGVGMIDAHTSLLGAGISKPGTMMIIIGTSSCHLTLSDTGKGIPGVVGLVYGGILPGYYGYEAGQSSVGDMFQWFIDNCIPADYQNEAGLQGLEIHEYLRKKIENYHAGQTGLLALDRFNGVRTPLNDYELNGLMIGLNLRTKPEDIYMALIESTAFGTRNILNQFENAGIFIDNIILSGGIPSKNKLLVQIYSDVCNRKVQVCSTNQASCYGAAMLGISAAKDAAGYTGISDITARLGKNANVQFEPNPVNAEIYDKLYKEYIILSDYFGRGQNDIMKHLNRIRNYSSQ